MKNLFWWLFGLFGVSLVFAAFFFDGTGDGGDSITHFLFAQYALKHPENFFNHWAKPLFVLLAMPFAQFGFIGVKIFNIGMTLISTFFAYRISQKIDLKATPYLPIFLGGMPLLLQVTLSGLTEPLSAAMLTFAIFAMFGSYKIRFIAIIIVSFLPFVRSEGLLLCGVFAIYLLWQRDYKKLPLLAVGHLIYSIVGGFFVYHDFFWVLNKIPYANTVTGSYGHGKLLHFLQQLYYGTSLPMVVLMMLGLVAINFSLFTTKNKNGKFIAEKVILIAGCSLIIIISHSIFWYFGIFNSFGMSRVLVTIMPLLAVIALVGYTFIIEYLARKVKEILILAVTLLLIIGFPIIKKTYSFANLHRSPDQNQAYLVNNFIQKEFPDRDRYALLYQHPYLAIALKDDFFNTKKSQRFTAITSEQTFVQPTILIWDNWFAVMDGGTEEAALRQNRNLRLVQAFRSEADTVQRMLVFKTIDK